MKDIRIKKLSLENFKCHKSLVLDFDGRNAAIYGDNAAGKTSIYDALTWLLFGKDSRGNGEKNIEIKPLDENGEVRDHMAVTAVEAVLLVGGEEIALRRTLQEVWSTKRGKSEATYDGNTSEYYIDGVPVKKYAFSDKVDELVNEDTFRLLTSVSHFADGISWQDRRAVLFKVAGVMDDATIMATNEAFQPLQDAMGKLAIDDYKTKLLAEKKGYMGTKNDIPARISECEKTIADVEALDFDGARAEVEALSAKREILEAQILSIENDSAAERKRLEIKEVNLESSTLERENKIYRDSQMSAAVDINGLKRELIMYQQEQKTKEAALDMQKRRLADMDKQIAACRQRWMAVNAESFVGGDCPTCGQKLPAAQIQAATEVFETDKRNRHREIEATANALKDSKADLEARMKMLEDEIQLAKTCEEAKQAEIERAEASRVEPVDMDGFAEKRAALAARLEQLNGELSDMMLNTAHVRCELQREVSEIKGAIKERMEILSKEALLDYSRKRIEVLRADARAAAACLESIEQMLYLIDEYTRYKTQFVENSINGLFRIARFRLFREQANGGIEPRCDVVYDGVPYISVNNGAKINVGIDIINTLSRAYGVKVPLFVDNAESVTHIEAADCQIIRLVVSENDKEVRLNYEN